MGTGQMSRFVAHEPDSTASPSDFYHAIFVTDRLDESLVALALSLKLDLEDVLYVSAKTSHTQRRPKTEALDREFKQGLRRAFYGDHYASSEPPLPLPRSQRPADFSPDAALYHDAVARLDATIAALPAFDVHLRRFRKMQGRLVEACARGGSRRARLGRDAGACLYGDQGCGYRCIDEWAAERAKRLAERRDRGNSPFVDRAREMAREAAAPAPDSPFIDRAREMARGEERVGTVVTSLLERFRRGGATAASPVAAGESASPRVEASPSAAPAAPAAGAGSVQQSLLDKFRSAAAS